MTDERFLAQARVLFVVILLNFIAQILYFVHLYLGRQSWLISLRSFLILGLVCAFFLVASSLLFKGRPLGYPLMLLFLSVEFLFYLSGSIGSAVRGNGLFFQLGNPDPVLRIVFAISYLNLFASGYFLFLLLYRGPHGRAHAQS
jgi:hypothetical protein